MNKPWFEEREREREIPSNIQQKKCSMVSAEKKGRRIHEEKKTRNACFIGFVSIPRCSMYGRFTYIWLKLMVNVGRYTIHGAYIYIYMYIKQHAISCCSFEIGPSFLVLPLLNISPLDWSCLHPEPSGQRIAMVWRHLRTTSDPDLRVFHQVVGGSVRVWERFGGCLKDHPMTWISGQ